MKHIVVGFAGGDASRHAVLTAAHLARDLSDANLEVVQVVPPVIAKPVDTGAARESDDAAVAENRPALEELLSESRASWRYRTETGEPALQLARVADELDAYLIVVGTREHGVLAFLERLLAGSVADSLQHNQARPVLVVPLPDDQ